VNKDVPHRYFVAPFRYASSSRRTFSSVRESAAGVYTLKRRSAPPCA